jgi:lipopolysaccharide export system protein LptA
VTQALNLSRWIRTAMAALVVAFGLAATQGLAQAPRPLFKANPKQREQPIKITSATLEVQDKKKVATFTGDVHVIQGETDLRCKVLVIYYDNDEGGGGKVSKSKATPVSAPAGPDGSQKIRRMEARGEVVMTQKDQRAVGDHADFDVAKNTMLLTGNVILTRGDDIVRGTRLFVNMTTGVYTVDSDGRVEMLINSKSSQQHIPGPQRGRTN